MYSDNDPRYIYFRKDRDNNAAGAISVAYQFTGVGTVKIAATFTKTSNGKAKKIGTDKFSRKSGRLELQKKFESDCFVTIPIRGLIPSYKDMVDTTMQLLRLAIDTDHDGKTMFKTEIPGWARKFIAGGFVDEHKVRLLNQAKANYDAHMAAG